MGDTKGSLLGRRLSRAHFLRLVGTGAGLSFVPTSLAAFGGRSSNAQTTGTPAILSPGGEYPIGIWWPPPPEQTTVERYKQITDAGFNFVIGGNGIRNDDTNEAALQAATANNLGFLLFDQTLRNTINGTTVSASANTQEAETSSIMQHLLEQDASRQASLAATESTTSDLTVREEIKQRIQHLLGLHGTSPALAGLNLYDEPHKKLFEILGFAKEEVLQQSAGEELPYVNIWPSYASSKALGTSTYQQYLKLYFEKVYPPLLSFDHYPLLSKNKITSDYFYNWAVIRKFSLQYGVPSWVFIQSVGFDASKLGLAKRRRPNQHEIFWQINVSLAYGAKGIQYFTYWTPSDPQVKFGDALVTRDGYTTSLYDYATKANKYLKVIGKALLPLTSESVVHAKEKTLPRGAKAFKADNYIRSVVGSRVILGRFLDESIETTDRYLLVANRSFLKAAETKLKLSSLVSGVLEVNSETGELKPVTLTGTAARNLLVKLAPGRARLYLLQTN